MNNLWNDEAGFVVSTELALIATVLVIGMVVGLTTIRDQVVQELADLAGMFAMLQQSYSFSAITGHHSSNAGSYGVDLLDSCDISCGANCGDTSGNGASCVSVFGVARHES